MKIPTSYLRMTAIAVLTAGLIGCGGGGGDGGPAIPTASNAAISPPPTTAVAIAAGAQTTNTTIAAAAFQGVNGAGLQTIGNLPSLAGAVTTTPAATETRRLMIAEIVRRHAEKIKDYMGSAPVAGAQIVQTVPCLVGGTETAVVDDMNGNFSQIFVNCDEGGVIFHGTISSTGVSANVTLGSTVGSSYNISVTATITIDLSITVTNTNPATVLVSQGSFSFSVALSGTMVSGGTSGVMPGSPTHTETRITGPSLLASDGVVGGVVNNEQLANFDLTVVDDDVTGTTVTVGSHFTYANNASAINGAVTVNITTPIHYALGAVHPDAGVIEITSTVSTGKIRVTFAASGVTPVKVEVLADGVNVSDTYTLSWVQFDALI